VLAVGADAGERVQRLLRQLAVEAPDVLTAAAWNFVSALKRETTDIPIVMLATWEPQRLGFITSLARPEGNVTGVAWFDLLSKRMLAPPPAPASHKRERGLPSP